MQKPSEATSSDVREDADAAARLRDSVDLLTAAGYFRARIKGIDVFDKIVGGMVWCIQLCAHSVDVDLLWTESASIGQKIALVERIVVVLPQLKCPHAIEPHQIQGLDGARVFPVVQWLVRRAMEAKKENGDVLIAHAEYLAGQGREREEESDLCRRFSRLRADTAPRRRFKRADAFHPATMFEDIACTLAEFKHGESATRESKEKGEREEEEEEWSMEAVGGRSKATGRAVRELVDEEGIRALAMAKKSSGPVDVSTQIARLEADIAKLESEKSVLDGEWTECCDRVAEARGEWQGLEEEKERRRRAEQGLEEGQLEELSALLDQYSHLQEREAVFKRECRERMAEMERQREEMEGEEDRGEGEDASLVSVDRAAAGKQLAEARSSVASVSQRVARLQRRVDMVPGQIELAQYQKRFIELYNEIGSKHRETRQQIALHNSLLDRHTLMKREIELLNKIEEVLPQAKREEFRDSFLQQLTSILRGVEGGMDKAREKEALLYAERDALAARVQTHREKERTFQTVAEQLKQELSRNEELRRSLAERGVEVE